MGTRSSHVGVPDRDLKRDDPMQLHALPRIVSDEPIFRRGCDEQGNASGAGGGSVVRDAHGDDRRLKPVSPQAKLQAVRSDPGGLFRML